MNDTDQTAANDLNIQTAGGAPIAPKRRTFGELLTSDLRALPVVVGLVSLWIFFAFQSDVFLSARNISNLLLQSTVVGIMALGIMFVLLVREIDLSIAAINGITAVLMAKLIVEFGFSPWLAIPVSVVFGVLIGMSSARWITFAGVPSFVVTLGLGLALNGAQLLLLPNTARFGLMNTGVEKIAQTTIDGTSAWLVFAIFFAIIAILILSSAQRRKVKDLHVPVMTSVVLPLAGSALFGAVIVAVMNSHKGIPLPMLIFAILIMIGGYVLKETAFGLSLFAIGNNDEAARRAGIKVATVKMAAFGIAGGIAALAGTIAASRTLGVGVFSGGGIGGGTLLLESIAAAVIGGVSLFGGRGAIYSAVLGCLVIGTVQNGLNLMGVENEIRLIVTGFLLVLAVSIDKIIEKATGQKAF